MLRHSPLDDEAEPMSPTSRRRRRLSLIDSDSDSRVSSLATSSRLLSSLLVSCPLSPRRVSRATVSATQSQSRLRSPTRLPVNTRILYSVQNTHNRTDCVCVSSFSPAHRTRLEYHITRTRTRTLAAPANAGNADQRPDKKITIFSRLVSSAYSALRYSLLLFSGSTLSSIRVENGVSIRNSSADCAASSHFHEPTADNTDVWRVMLSTLVHCPSVVLIRVVEEIIAQQIISIRNSELLF